MSNQPGGGAEMSNREGGQPPETAPQNEISRKAEALAKALREKGTARGTTDPDPEQIAQQGTPRHELLIPDRLYGGARVTYDSQNNPDLLYVWGAKATDEAKNQKFVYVYRKVGDEWELFRYEESKEKRGTDEVDLVDIILRETPEHLKASSTLEPTEISHEEENLVLDIATQEAEAAEAEDNPEITALCNEIFLDENGTLISIDTIQPGSTERALFDSEVRISIDGSPAHNVNTSFEHTGSIAMHVLSENGKDWYHAVLERNKRGGWDITSSEKSQWEDIITTPNPRTPLTQEELMYTLTMTANYLNPASDTPPTGEPAES